MHSAQLIGQRPVDHPLIPASQKEHNLVRKIYFQVLLKKNLAEEKNIKMQKKIQTEEGTIAKFLFFHFTLKKV